MLGRQKNENKIGLWLSSHWLLYIQLSVAYCFTQYHGTFLQPSWSGQMQMLHINTSNPGRSSEYFLPMLDLKPTDSVCIRSTLEYLIEQARKYNTSAVITFDQQIWWLAYMIIESEPSTPPHQIVLLLGGFHAEASFLGTTRSTMDGAGLKEAITTVYAEGGVDGMLSDKAISRAARSHILVDNALLTIITARALALPVPRIDASPVEVSSGL